MLLSKPRYAPDVWMQVMYLHLKGLWLATAPDLQTQGKLRQASLKRTLSITGLSCAWPTHSHLWTLCTCLHNTMVLL